MAAIRTRITELLSTLSTETVMLYRTDGLHTCTDITTPIISAPMGGATSGALAAKVTNAGGFGFIAAGTLRQ